jgi:hypothetical protein
MNLTEKTTETTETAKTLEKIDITQIKKDIEERVNPKTIQDGIAMLNAGDNLQSIIQSAFTEFEQKSGRQMTYSEMREMMG